MVNQYQPDVGHFIMIDCSPQAGREQEGGRPAIVITQAKFNIATGLIWACPITNQVKGSPFEVRISSGAKVTGVILTDQLKSFDWLNCKVKFIDIAPMQLIDEVIARNAAIMGY